MSNEASNQKGSRSTAFPSVSKIRKNEDHENFKISKSPTFTSTLLTNMFEMKQSRNLTDFTLIIQGVKLPCHRLVLGSACLYFKVMFESGLTEASQSSVELDNIDPTYMERVIDYCYTGDIEIKMSEAKEYLQIIDYLQMDHLKEHIDEYITMNLDIDNCLEWFIYSNQIMLKHVKRKSGSIIKNSLYEVTNSTEFKELIWTDLQIIMDIFKNSENSDSLLRISAAWFSYDVKGRTSAFKNLLECISLDKCSLPYLKHVMEEFNDVFKSEAQLYDKFSKVFFLSIPSLDYSYVAKNPARKLLVVGGITQLEKSTKQCWSIDLTSGEKTLKTNIPGKLSCMKSSFCKAPGGFFLCSLREENGLFYGRYSFMYDTTDDLWVKVPLCDRGIEKAAVISMGNKIITFGGIQNPNRIFVYFTVKSKWKLMKKSMPESISYPMAVKVNENVYIFNTRESDTEENDNERPIKMLCYNSATFKWKRCAPLPHRTSKGLSMVAHYTSVYVLGGNSRVCARFCTLRNKWTVLQPPPLRHHYGCAVASDRSIYLCGGRNDAKECTNRISVYDISQDKWQVSNITLPVPVKHLHCMLYE